MVVEEFEEITWRWGVDDRRRDDLVHGLVIGWVRGVVDEASAAHIDAAR